MDERSVSSQVREFVIDSFLFGDREAAPGEEESFLASGLIDSTGMLELVFFVEQAFDIRIEDSELLPDNLDSCARIAGFVARKRGG